MAEVRQLSWEEKQNELLDGAKRTVKEQSYHMQRSLDADKVMDALKHASNMISELRTSLLSPTKYYDLYMQVCDELRHLSLYLADMNKNGQPMADLYELVQYAGNIIPRLFLLITVGAVYIESKEAPAKDILLDLVELCRGVQHPTRGLFLRDYLSQQTKDHLPDIESDSELSGTVRDSVDFILSNFTEMNKLWVRLQHQGTARDREIRERERQQLKVLVGTNLVRLSRLEGLDSELYKNTVFPSLMEQVVTCKDTMAQEYLMESVIQAFPDELHLETLSSILETIGAVENGVNVRHLVVSLINRLAQYAQREDSNIPEELQLFKIFSQQVASVIEKRPSMPLNEILELQCAMLSLSLSVYIERPEYANEILETSLKHLKAAQDAGLNIHQSKLSNLVCSLLREPVLRYNSISQVLALESFPQLFALLPYDSRRMMATFLIRNMLQKQYHLTDASLVALLLEVIATLVIDAPDAPADEDDDDDEEFVEEQELVSRLIHLFVVPADPDQTFQNFVAARKHFGRGGPKRLRYTLIPLVVGALHLPGVYSAVINDENAEEGEGELAAKKLKKVFRFIHETNTALAAEAPETALTLFLQAALVADKTDSDDITYEFITQAFTLYEEQVSDTKKQMHFITLMIGTLNQLVNLSEENLDIAVTKTAVYANKLMKKHDQAEYLSYAAALWWSASESGLRDGQRVADILKKAMSVAGKALKGTGDPVQLLPVCVIVLNKYVQYILAGVEEIDVDHVSQVISLIKNNADEVEEWAGSDAEAHFRRTISFIKEQAGANEKLASVEC
eukprot:GCRY01002909.1.p1 GENE.GCRY01002909.1~~GCRY01002909.1.p1  ORF type:complete len:796 (+),score=300.60 GCRY01002909.1:168-2555(+)